MEPVNFAQDSNFRKPEIGVGGAQKLTAEKSNDKFDDRKDLRVNGPMERTPVGIVTENTISDKNSKTNDLVLLNICSTSRKCRVIVRENGGNSVRKRLNEEGKVIPQVHLNSSAKYRITSENERHENEMNKPTGSSERFVDGAVKKPVIDGSKFSSRKEQNFKGKYSRKFRHRKNKSEGGWKFVKQIPSTARKIESTESRKSFDGEEIRDQVNSSSSTNNHFENQQSQKIELGSSNSPMGGEHLISTVTSGENSIEKFSSSSPSLKQKKNKRFIKGSNKLTASSTLSNNLTNSSINPKRKHLQDTGKQNMSSGSFNIQLESIEEKRNLKVSKEEIVLGPAHHETFKSSLDHDKQRPQDPQAHKSSIGLNKSNPSMTGKKLRQYIYIYIISKDYYITGRANSIFCAVGLR